MSLEQLSQGLEALKANVSALDIGVGPSLSPVTGQLEMGLISGAVDVNNGARWGVVDANWEGLVLPGARLERAASGCGRGGAGTCGRGAHTHACLAMGLALFAVATRKEG